MIHGYPAPYHAPKLLDEDGESNGVMQTPSGAKSQRKPLSAVYNADKRTYSWMKLKKDYVAGIGDSIDMVPIGAWHGNGRKAQWWSPILLGLWDQQIGKVVAVCKCMSGMTHLFRVWVGIRMLTSIRVH